MKFFASSVGFLGLFVRNVFAVIELDLTNTDSIKRAASTAAAGMVQYYTGYRPGDVPGNLPDPYYWWEAGAMFGALIDYWYFTGDPQYNDITIQAMLHQAGPDRAFMPLNQSSTLGNDDQAFWGMAAMGAAENKFPNPPEDQPQWLALAQAVFNTQTQRWNEEKCGGGLKWQIFLLNKGFNYRNTISNGCYFNLGARLATYTGNKTYADLAERTWNWSGPQPGGIGLFDENYNFYDGSDDSINCTKLDHHQWSYNPGVFLAGAANMYNFTNGSAIWEERLRGIIGNLKLFLVDNVLTEAGCEVLRTCNTDQRSFKAYLARWSAATIVRAPFTRDLLMPILEASAKAAAATCNGGKDGKQCTMYWTNTSQPFETGVGEQMSALEVFQSNLLSLTSGPATIDTGISKGDPAAGGDARKNPNDFYREPMTTADKAGAAIVTVLIVSLAIATAAWLVTGD